MRFANCRDVPVNRITCLSSSAKEKAPRCAINYRKQDFAELRDIDLVLDTIGGETLEKSWSVLSTDGRIATLVEFGIKPRNGHSGEFVFFADATPYLPVAARSFEAGQLQIITDSFFPLEEARSALEKLVTGHSRGKVVLRNSHSLTESCYET